LIGLTAIFTEGNQSYSEGIASIHHIYMDLP